MMSKHGSRSCFLKYLNLVKLVKVHIEFHLVPFHVEAGMFSHLRVRTDTGQQGMEVFNTFTITVSLTHANLVAIFSVVE